jgi:hypothetical protein
MLYSSSKNINQDHYLLACCSIDQKTLELATEMIHTKERVAVQKSLVFGFKNNGCFMVLKACFC